MKKETIDKEPEIYCRYTEIREAKELKENPKNPNKHPKYQLERLAEVIRTNGWRAPVTVSDLSGLIVKGHGRLQAAKLAGLTKIPVEIQHYETAADEMADLLADNRIAELAEIDGEAIARNLQELQAQGVSVERAGFSDEEMNALCEQLVPQDEKEEKDADESEKLQQFKVELTERMEKAQYVFWSFSGGRDSTRALIATWKAFVETGKHCEVLYVENTCEFPDLVMHIRRVCKMLGAKLTTIHPDKTYLTEYYEKGISPKSLYMDCVEELINKPLNKYIKSVAGDEDYILVRGGQPKQKTNRSKSAELQVVDSKPHMIIYNPCFSMTKEQLEAKIPEWPGYAAGFVRTACWCCPFQLPAQYDALRANYPLLFEEMKTIMGEIRCKSFGLKTYDDKFKYWEKHGVKLKWDKKPIKKEKLSSLARACSERGADGTEKQATPEPPKGSAPDAES